MIGVQRASGVVLRAGAVCTTVALLAASAMAGETLAVMTGGGGSIEWRVLADSNGVVLTVAGPTGAVVRREFGAGQSAVFALFDKAGGFLPDGVYRYELQVLPRVSSEARRQAEAGRASAEPELAPPVSLPRGGTQSGTFALRGGALVTGTERELILSSPLRSGAASSTSGSDVAPMDQVIPDDLIVQGSACIGLDCVNNESFGFDTVRLKENNTRIKFEDTSASAGFPTNDWQITANDSAQGGADKFSVEDITGSKVPFTLTAGAPTNSIFLDSTGRLGLRTSTPVLDVHANTSNTPAMRFEQNNTGGFTAQTWDVAGNEANFFVRDVTGGSRLPFRIRPGAPTSSIDIAATGFVGIGWASPTELLHVRSDVDSNIFITAENASNTANAQTALRARSNTAQVTLRTHADARVLSRFGVVLGGWAEILQTTGNGLVIGTDNVANPLILGTGSLDRLHITGAGNVGIGTPTPAGKLDVNGSIFQRGGLLFADYVFEPSYRLETIDQHAASMWKNRHLPAMPSRQVDAEGRELIEIGAQARGMLEELEKAHIYIAELNRRLEEKDKTLAEVERQGAALADRLARLEAALAAGSKQP